MKYVFTLCGGHISPILVACEKLGIRIVDTRHEVMQNYWSSEFVSSLILVKLMYCEFLCIALTH